MRRPDCGSWSVTLAPHEKPAVLRGEADRDNEPIIQNAKQRHHLIFQIASDRNHAAMYQQDWQDSGASRKARTATCDWAGWRRDRRIVILQRI